MRCLQGHAITGVKITNGPRRERGGIGVSMTRATGHGEVPLTKQRPHFEWISQRAHQKDADARVFLKGDDCDTGNEKMPLRWNN